jgi:beta-N-acetylhexosaminidase
MDSVRDIAGLSLIVGVSGTVLTDEERALLSEIKPLGVILFKRNYSNPAQLKGLVDSIRDAIGREDVIFCVDQEGGRVQRFAEPFTIIPSAEIIGRTENEYLATEVGKIIAKELSACGINMNLAPVCDINTNPENQVIGDRAYGRDAETVMRMSESVLMGLVDGGVLTCAKHFPGHGDTSLDSHEELPICSKTMDELYERELLPFLNIIDKGVDSVMLAHILFENIDREFPASMSRRFVDFLRMEAGFDGIIMSDDMEMKAISKRYRVPEASLLSIKNGVDVVLICHTPQIQKEAYNLIRRYYLDNPDIVEAKFNRLNKLLAGIKIMDYDISIIGCEEHKQVIEEIKELANS